jgi:hypothetical protein
VVAAMAGNGGKLMKKKRGSYNYYISQPFGNSTAE